MQNIANPVVKYATLAEASKALGFEAREPAVLSEGLDEIAVISQKVLHLAYKNGLTYRMAKGTDDISGRYEAYREVNEVSVGGCRVTEKGFYGKVFLACWTDGTYAYSFYTPYGVQPDSIQALIESVGADSSGIPCPIVRYDAVYLAEYAVGFGIKVPGCIHNKAFQAVYVISGKVAEISYANDINYRISKLTGDISGVQNRFPKTDSFRLDRYSVVAKGDDVSYYLTLWTDGKLNYSLYAPHGLNRKEIEEFISTLTLIN